MSLVCLLPAVGWVKRSEPHCIQNMMLQKTNQNTTLNSFTFHMFPIGKLAWLAHDPRDSELVSDYLKEAHSHNFLSQTHILSLPLSLSLARHRATHRVSFYTPLSLPPAL